MEQLPSKQLQYHLLTDEELANLAARRGRIYAAWPAEERPRLSLAGAQDRCPVLMKGDRCFLPQGEAPSSHIMKFEPAYYRHLPAFETFTTMLAGSIGLSVVDIELCTIEQTRYALVARYDRQWDEAGEVQWPHQVDFCQALGYGHEKKYQESGGAPPLPSADNCFRMLPVILQTIPYCTCRTAGSAWLPSMTCDLCRWRSKTAYKWRIALHTPSLG